jgi:tetratricopeptide (TPR) repeat protein
MKPSLELFQLVKSLTKSEKRFFKLSSSLQQGDKNYLKIFDLIEKQDVYDEEAIKETFKGETFIRHLPSEKNHLYRLILKSLRSFYADSSISSVLRQEIKNVEILYKKALYKECRKFIARAKKLAIEHEKFYYWFELLNWEKTLLEEAFESGEFDVDLDKLLEEEQLVIDKLRNLAEYQMLYSRINYLYRSGGFTRNDEERKEVDKIAQHHLITGKGTAISVRATSICYYIQGLCNATNRDYPTAFDKFTRVKNILDQNPLIRKDLAKRYTLTLKHLMNCYLEGNNLDEAQKIINTMREIVNEPGFGDVSVTVKIFTSTSIAELLIAERKGDYTKVLELADNLANSLDVYNDKLHKEQQIIIYYNLAYAYFGAGDYNKALRFINHILNDNEQILRQDIYSFARLFNLVIHYELGNYDLLEYVIKSTSRFFSKQVKDYEVEGIIITHLKKLMRTPNPADKRKVYLKAKEDMEKAFSIPAERVVLHYFDFLVWVNAKIDATSFAESARKSHQINLGA